MKRDIEDLLEKLRDELGLAVGSNLEQVVLYGSCARGDEEPDSDLDVLVVLRESSQSERERIHRVAYKLMWDCEFSPLISLNIIDREHYQLLREAGTSYLGNILREGIPLWPISETKANIG
jgi:predicted nucleotidyltransferase